jgi:putative flippase GtrA
MTKNDIIFAGLTGFFVAFIFADFLWVTKFSYLALHLFWLFPLLSIAGLWICEHLGKKFKFIHEAGKFFLVGAFSAVVDIKVYQIFAGLLAVVLASSLISKAISFLVATAVKYGGNKIWVFEKNGKDGIKKEIIQFTVITTVGMVIDVFIFYCATHYFQPANAPVRIWTEISIIIAALVAAVWNFLGYKFIVFKK